MFRRIDAVAPGTEVIIDVDGVQVVARAGDTLAAAMLIAGCLPFRVSVVLGEPRGPLCLIGACFECRVEIDGIAERRACQVTVRPGLRVRRSRSARPIG